MRDAGMTDPLPTLPYQAWLDDAFRHLALQALEHVSRHGFPGNHHFVFSFRTDYPGVVIPRFLLAKYPHSISISLQEAFTNLVVDRAGRRFSVGLTFGGTPATISVPADALISFVDPHVHFATTFGTSPATETGQTEPPPSPTEAEHDGDNVIILARRRRRAES